MEIKDIQGNILVDVPITESAVKTDELMKQYSISLRWSAVVNDELPLGSYIEYEGVRYSLLAPYQPKQKDEVEYEYEPVFQHPVMRWQYLPFLFYTYSDGKIVSKEPDWSLTDNAANFMSVVCDAIKQMTGENWTYEIADNLPASVSLSFSNTDIFSALGNIASQFETEWWFDYSEKVIFLSKASYGNAVELEVGKNIGVPSINQSKSGYYTRFLVFGSTRNIEQNYQGTNTNSIVNKRLTLNPAKYPNGYIDIKAGLTNEEILVKTLTFDDIYPRSMLTISNVKVRLMWRLDSDNQKVQIGTDASGKPIYDQYAIWYFKIPGLSFNKDMVISGKALSVHFNDGPLSGREFELTYHDVDKDVETSDGTSIRVDAGDFEINFIEEGTYIIPAMTGLVPVDGNSVSLFNIVMPEEYKTSAYEELEKAALKEIAKQEEDTSNYSFSSNAVEFFMSNPALKVGRKVTYKNGDYSYSTRVIKLETQLDRPYEQKITIGNEQIKGNTQTLKEEVVSANQNIDLISAINESTQQLMQSYQRTQKALLDSMSKWGNMWRLDAENNAVYTPLNMIVGGTLAMGDLGKGGSETPVAWLQKVSITIPNYEGPFVSDAAGNVTLPAYPSALKNPHALIINGVHYDGSKEITIDLEGGGGIADAVVRIMLGDDAYDAVNGVVKLPAYPSLSGYATESWVGDNYLSKKGGSLSGDLTVSKGNLIVSVGHTVTGWLYPKDDNASSLGQSTRRWSDVQTVLINGGTPIHSGNIGSYNAGSATKLQDNTTYKAWGQTFFENGVPKSVSGDIHLNQSKIYWHSDANNYYIGTYYDGTTNPILDVKYYGGIRFFTSATERMRIATNGNVGINKPNPTSKLDISGDIKSEGANYIYDSTSRTSRLCFAWASDIASVYAIKEDGTAYKNLRLGYYSTTANNGLYMLASKGYWGINNDSPAYALDVNGSIQASSALISKGATYDSVWTNGGYYCNGSYDGSSWGKGQGGLNIPITNNSSQTPLIVAMRRGNSPATAGATRLFAMECLNTGGSLRWYFGSYCALEMTSAGALNVYGSIKVSGTTVSLEGHTHGAYYDSTISRTANHVLAAPNGSNGSATFRALVAADIPSLAASKITSGTFDAARIPSLDASKIGSGTLGVDRIPALNGAKIISGEGTSVVTDGTEILTSYASDNGFADANAPNYIYRRKASLLYSYIKGKLDLVYLSQADALKNYQPLISLTAPLPYSYLSGAPTALKNPKSLTINNVAYDGSEAKTVTITAAGLGALTAHQTIYALTINNSAGTAQVTYTPNSKAATLTLSKSMVGLGNVENTALSSWAGTNKITTLGTITTGTWNGSKIGNSYLSNSSVTIAGSSVSLGGEITAATLKSNLGLGSLAYKSSLVASDIPKLDWSKITSGKPTTLSGYGITDNVAYREAVNNFMHNSNEFTFAKGSYSSYIWINYRTASGNTDGAITEYRFGKGAGASYANVRAAKFIVNGGTSSHFLKGDGSVDSTSYLSTAGGTISGSLSVTGDIWTEGTIAMAKLASSSDRKLKKDIKWLSTDKSMEIVRALKPTEWTWKKDDTRSYGFIAQDIQPIIPEMVCSANDTLRLEYNQLHAFEIAALQHIDSEVETLKKDLKTANNRIEVLENELKEYRRNA